MKKLIAVAAAVALTVGCASKPSSLTPGYTPTSAYAGTDCRKLMRQRGEIVHRTEVLEASLQKKANLDAVQLGVGLVLFWPALFLLEFGDGPEAMEYQRLAGQLHAIDQVCGGI